jgi:hypothetical protein
VKTASHSTPAQLPHHRPTRTHIPTYPHAYLIRHLRGDTTQQTPTAAKGKRTSSHSATHVASVTAGITTSNHPHYHSTSPSIMEDKSKAMVVVEATPKYHLLPTAEVMAAVGGKEATATPAAIEEQRRRFGSNALAEPQVSALEQGVVSCVLTFSLAHQLYLTHPRSHVVAILIQPLCACKHSLSTFALALCSCTCAFTPRRC